MKDHPNILTTRLHHLIFSWPGVVTLFSRVLAWSRGTSSPSTPCQDMLTKIRKIGSIGPFKWGFYMKSIIPLLWLIFLLQYSFGISSIYYILSLNKNLFGVEFILLFWIYKLRKQQKLTKRKKALDFLTKSSVRILRVNLHLFPQQI